MQAKVNDIQSSFAQNTLNNQRDAGLNLQNQCVLIKDSLPAFTAMQDSKNPENICHICGKKRRRETIICGIKYSFHVMCKCEEEQEKFVKEKLEKLNKMRKIEKLKSLSLLGKR